MALPENGLGDQAGCFAICGLVALAIATLFVIGLNGEPSDQLAEKIHTLPGSIASCKAVERQLDLVESIDPSHFDRRCAQGRPRVGNR